MARRTVCPNDGRAYVVGEGCSCGYGRRRDPGQIERLRRQGIPTSSAERKRRREAVAAWVADHGWICPGYRVPTHASRDLTADHVVPQARGGVDGPIIVRCRSCNSRRAAEETNRRRGSS